MQFQQTFFFFISFVCSSNDINQANMGFSAKLITYSVENVKIQNEY